MIVGSHSCSTRELCRRRIKRSQLIALRTTYMGQVMAYELGREPDPELATRTGEFAMLMYSIGTHRLSIVRPFTQ